MTQLLDPGKWGVFGVLAVVVIIVVDVEVSATVVIIGQELLIGVQYLPGQLDGRGVDGGRQSDEEEWLDDVPPGGDHWLTIGVEQFWEVGRVDEVDAPAAVRLLAATGHHFSLVEPGLHHQVVLVRVPVQQLVDQFPDGAAQGHERYEQEYDECGHVEVEQTVVVFALTAHSTDDAQHRHQNSCQTHYEYHYLFAFDRPELFGQSVVRLFGDIALDQDLNPRVVVNYYYHRRHR